MDKLKTELSLRLPGCSDTKSPDNKLGLTIFGKDLDECTKNGNNSCCSGAKRVFSDSIGCQQRWLLSINGTSLSNFSNGKDVVSLTNPPQLSPPPLAKAQVVGWPPIRSFRKNTMASTSSAKNNETEEKFVSACLYVKVSMDGAPYLRKVDLQTYTNYMELSSALEKMFSCFIKGQNDCHSHASYDDLIENHSSDYVRDSEYVLTYEDKDGDWMLVGDVPWKMFTENCRKLRITKGSDATGLAPKCS